MALDIATLVRNGVATANSLTASLQGEVLISFWLRENSFGKIVYGRRVEGVDIYSEDPAAVGVAEGHDGLVEYQTKTREVNGRLIVTYALITFIHPFDDPDAPGRKGPVDPRDYIVLPNGKTGPIVDVQGFMDAATSQPFFVQVWLGALQERGV